MLRIAIVDDEKSFLVSLKKRILAICEKNDYFVSISTTTDPYSVLENELYKHNDIILLDIEMPNISGLDIASEINKQKGNSDLPYIIFHTENTQYRERNTIEERAIQLLSKGFVRPHIGYLINVRYIDEIMPQTVRLIDGTLIPLSKKYRKEVKQKFYEWVVKIK